MPEGEPEPGGWLAGVHVPVVTPFDAVTGEIDLIGLRANVRRVLTAPVRGVVVAGAMGEGVLLDRRERKAAVDAARGVMPDDRVLIAGTGGESTRTTLLRTRDTAEAGADAVLVQPPSFYQSEMDRAALEAHYRSVADASPVPVILDRLPSAFATVELSAVLVAELSAHPNVVGIQHSGGRLDALGDILTHARRGFEILAGDSNRFYVALEIGVAGGILGLANLVPGELVEMQRAFQQGRTAEAGRIQERVGPAAKAIAQHGVAGMKAALDFIGAHGGPPRAPLRPVNSRGRARIRAALAALDLV